LNRRQDKAAKEPADHDDHAHHCRLQRRKRGNATECGPDQDSSEPAAYEAFDGLGRTNGGRQHGSSKELTENVLEDVADLNDDRQVEKQKGIGERIAPQVEQ
jgi:hypothetical protein